MELRSLRYFVAVADAGSVTSGSAAVHVSQPAVSRQIRALEHELGVTLFVRSEGGVRLTAAGSELLAQARDMLEREAFLKRTALSLAAGRLVSLTIAAPSTTLGDVVAPFLAARPVRRVADEGRASDGDGASTQPRAEFGTEGQGPPCPSVPNSAQADPADERVPAPPPSINVIARSTDDVFAALDEGADLVVAPAVPPRDVASVLIAELPVRAYVGARGVLADNRPRSVTVEALAAVEPLVMLPAHYPVSQAVTRAFADAGLAPAQVQEVDSPEAAQALAASGRGVAVLTNDPRFGLIPRRIVDGEGVVLTLPLYAAWARHHHAATELRDVAQGLRAFCRQRYREDLSV